MRVVQSDGARLTLELTRNELVTLNNALNEVCNGPDAIAMREFHTRIGVQPIAAHSLLLEIGAALGRDSGSRYFDNLS